MEHENKLKIAEQALKDVVDPIGKMKRELGDGYALDGQMAMALSRDANYAKQIAQTALDRIQF